MGDKKAIVSVLTELEKMIRNGENFESIVKRWADSNPGVPAIEEGLREAYALTLGAAIKYFQSVSEKESAKKHIEVLSNLKMRTKNYASMYSEYGEEYAKELARVDAEAIDYALSVIQGSAE